MVGRLVNKPVVVGRLVKKPVERLDGWGIPVPSCALAPREVEVFDDIVFVRKLARDSGLAAGRHWRLVGALLPSLGDEEVSELSLLMRPADVMQWWVDAVRERVKKRPWKKIFLAARRYADLYGAEAILGACDWLSRGADGVYCLCGDLDPTVRAATWARPFVYVLAGAMPEKIRCCGDVMTDGLLVCHDRQVLAGCLKQFPREEVVKLGEGGAGYRLVALYHPDRVSTQDCFRFDVTVWMRKISI